MLENIIEGNQYTLLIENSFGFIVSRKVKIKKAFIESYAQHKETLVIHYIEKGKRKITGTRFIDNKICIIEGWKDIKGALQDDNINTFESFESGKFESIIELNRLNPVYQYGL